MTVSVNVSLSPGVVTGQVEGRGDVDLIALVSDARQWVLAATGDSVFPSVKVLTYRKTHPVGPYGRNMSRVLGGS